MGPGLLGELAEKGNVPSCTTLQGLGAFDEMNDKSLHMICMHGSAYDNLTVRHADVIIALGARLTIGKVNSFAPAARAAALQSRGGIIHFEIMPKNVNKVVEAQIPIVEEMSSPIWLHLCSVDPTCAKGGIGQGHKSLVIHLHIREP
jgi:acetolactate synthase-1/2/3 large subunit